jgi:SAM-dependent methyltransferase
MSEIYTPEFFEGKRQRRTYSALQIMKVVSQLLRPHSVADFGCGDGTWLKAAAEIGAVILDGYDGSWVSPSGLDSRINFTAIDFEAGFGCRQDYDLAMSLEVAEHLTPAAGERLIATLCKGSKVILFSAAIPDQGGSNHINEQWQSYWASRFAQHDFECFDPVRPAIWSDNEIYPWYRQNILVFVHPAAANVDRVALGPQATARSVDLVIPEMYEGTVERLKTAGRITPRRIARNILHALPYGKDAHVAAHRFIRSRLFRPV